MVSPESRSRFISSATDRWSGVREKGMRSRRCFCRGLRGASSRATAASPLFGFPFAEPVSADPESTAGRRPLRLSEPLPTAYWKKKSSSKISASRAASASCMDAGACIVLSMAAFSGKPSDFRTFSGSSESMPRPYSSRAAAMIFRICVWAMPAVSE